MTLTASQIKAQAIALGFHRVGIAAIAEPTPAEQTSQAALQQWLNQGYQADMAWMGNSKRQDIRQVMPEARSLIAVALNYYTPHSHSQDPNHGKISRYGWGRDYHRVMTTKLKALAQWLQDQATEAQTRFYVDTGPVQDKFWAEQAGLGWVAKNGNLITRSHGSWVFLGEILTNLDLAADAPHTAHCGTCTRCLEACPTQAIVQPHVVDANRCIAYWTMEERGAFSAATPEWEEWVGGCDICQEVCPRNRYSQPHQEEAFSPLPHIGEFSQVEWEEIDEKAFKKLTKRTAMSRVKWGKMKNNLFMWKKNRQST